MMLLRFAVAVALLVAAANALQSVAIMDYKPEVRVKPFGTLPQASFAWIDGATVSIEFGYVPDYDRLLFDYDGSFNITSSFNSVNGVLYLSGQATASEYTNAIASVVFFTTSTDGGNRQISYSFGANTFYFSLTDHSYKFVSEEGLTWEAAMSRCGTLNFFGQQGYLATITSADEQMQISAKATFNAWIGANDVAQFGQYSWVVGPDANQTFWKGQSQYQGGALVGDFSFAAWNRFQPENPLGSGTDYVYLVNSADQDTSYWAVAKNSDLVPGYICEFGSPQTSSMLSTTGGSARLYASCSLYNYAECANNQDLGCSWSNSVGLCVQTTCSTYKLQSACENDNRCDWNTDGALAVCVNTACSSYSSTLCGTNNQCTVDKSSSQCRMARCSDRTSACGCNVLSGCVWRDGYCASQQTEDCTGTDVVFLVDGSVLMTESFGRFPQAFYGVTDMLADSEFAYNGNVAGTRYTAPFGGQRVGVVQFALSALTAPSGTGTGGRLTSNAAEFQADIAYLQANFAPVHHTRVIENGLVAARNMFDSAPNRTRVIVILASGALSDASTLAAQFSSSSTTGILASLHSLGVKVVGTALQAAASRTEQSVAAAASIMMITDDTLPATRVSTTIRDLQAQVLYGMCSLTTGLSKQVLGPRTSRLCARYPNATTCNNDALCGWNFAQSSCDNNLCISTCSSSDCNKNPACGFNSSMNMCVASCPMLNETTCDPNPACTFNFLTYRCENTPCVTNPTEDSCIADTFAAGCVWNPANDVPCSVTPCMTTDPTACGKETGCEWTGTTCVEDLCKLQTTSTGCATLSQCTWSLTAGNCRRNICGLHSTEDDCSNDYQCKWSISATPAACVPAPCTYYNTDMDTAKAMCTLDSANCQWSPKSVNGLKDMCVLKTCELQNRSCDCANLNGCIWRNNTCKSNPFVQCPATDVIFLVEASPVMERAFGRHPNGFVGILQAIKGWSDVAPFSPSVTSTGFRFQMIEYGQAGYALSVPSGVGSNGNLTGVPTEWRTDIDWSELNAPNYANRGQTGQVALTPALIKALQAFQGGNAPNRKKLLVIIGNSPIVDGGAKMNAQVKALEGMGVLIFANVVRRFSYLTAPDMLAAQFMRPIASDPPTVFFSYTTIDDLRSSILENFCDPSSETGKVLQISRNGEVPCDWLVGTQECNMQASCLWNSTAIQSCPLPGQCPSLNCQTLPPGLAALYSCQHCELQSGAIACSRSNPPQVRRGMCLKDACAKTCPTPCAATTACDWNEASSRCERAMCSPSAMQTMDACNANPGCTFFQDVNGTGKSGTCKKSVCSGYRSTITCETLMEADGNEFYNLCMMNRTAVPAVCMQRRCPQFNEETCKLPEVSGPSGACRWSSTTTPRHCITRTCQYNDPENCVFDTQCYWDQFKGQCLPRGASCVLSDYSDWSMCTSKCGAAVTYKSRAIVLYPSGGASCPAVAKGGCTGSSCATVDKSITVVQSCTSPPANYSGQWIPLNPQIPAGEWPMNCTLYCSDLTDRPSACMADSSCRWYGNKCTVKPFLGCQALNPGDCRNSDMCSYDSTLEICQPSMTVCPYTTKTLCNSVSVCHWRDGTNTISSAQTAGLPLQMFNPGQKAIYPFDTLAINSDTIIFGATVTIEDNYQRGKDVLQSTYNQNVSSVWIEAAGKLVLSGASTIADYAKTIQFVTFTTTSTRVAARRITWSLGNGTVYSSWSSHHYEQVKNAGATYNFAAEACQQKSLFGLRGYLATVTSESENDIVSTKLLANGWISGSDASGKFWQYTTGPEGVQNLQFWNGPSIALGGATVNGRYVNWAPPNATNLYGEPLIHLGSGGTTGNDRVYLAESGYWESRSFDAANVNGYICEYGGSTGDVQSGFPIGGGMIIGIGGCVADSCVWHANEAACGMDIECNWNNGVCETGCASRATDSECAQSSRCRWDTSVLPPVCDINFCAGLAVAPCQSDSRCEWSSASGCVIKRGCGMFGQRDCATQNACVWSTASNVCIERGCGTFTAMSQCRAIPRCRWDADSDKCMDQYCSFTSESQCATDAARCTWNPSDTLSVNFSPRGGYTYPFMTGVEPCADNSIVDGITVAVTAGYQVGADSLSLEPASDAQQNYMAFFDEAMGVLNIMVNSGVQVSAATAFQYMARNVRFSSTSGSLAKRTISYTLSLHAAYSYTSKTYIKFYPKDIPTSLLNARQLCEGKTLFGLQGALAVLNREEDGLLTRQLRAKGFIDASYDGANNWVWNTPTGPVTFWQGTGVTSRPAPNIMNGANESAYMYAQWNIGMPSGNGPVYVESSGFWRNSPFNNVGYPGVVCTFGNASYRATSAPSGVRLANPSGCFLSQCKPLGMSQCAMNVACRWTTSGCIRDTRCIAGGTVRGCVALANCYWDYSLMTCVAAGPNTCSTITNRTLCANETQCAWNPALISERVESRGACMFEGCMANPVESTCLANPQCKWSTSSGLCVARLCGYTDMDSCWRDKACVWENTKAYVGCTPSPCLANSSDATKCNMQDSCQYNNGLCEYVRCNTTRGMSACLEDKGCIFVNNKCLKPECNSTLAQAKCNMNSQCNFFVATKRCGAAQCISFLDKGSCEQGQTLTALKPCIWDASRCRELTFAEQNAPSIVNACEKQVNPSMWWLWLFLAVILILLGMILHRLYLAHAGKGNLFDPTRKNYKYNPHEQYAAALLDDAAARDVDANVTK